jgi:Protein of unknown function (DUF4231)
VSDPTWSAEPPPAEPPPAEPATPAALPDSAVTYILARATQQQAWYDAHAVRARIGYWSIKVIQLVLGAAVPVVAGVHAPAEITGSLGALIVVLEGIQQLFQFHENWIRYRLTATNLTRERNMYEARVGDYAGANPAARLALAVENIVNSEATSWARAAQTDTSAAPVAT